jgi:NADP-dependent 3-hydroxy acid dehydrogenase YdfG
MAFQRERWLERARSPASSKSRAVDGAALSHEHVHHAEARVERLAVVTGASSGIGRAIALALARQGVRLCVVGRNSERLGQTVAAAQSFVPVTSFQLDLTDETSMQHLVEHLKENARKLDILVHSAGMIQQGLFERASIEHLDQQYATNVRAPYLLTQRLLPLLVRARGQIAFINSSVGLSVSRPDIGQYAATKHALKAIADSLRAEVNPQGVRVLSVYLGRTATAMQEALFKQEAKAYRPAKLLQPEDVATMVLAALALPPTAEVTEISIRPMMKG